MPGKALKQPSLLRLDPQMPELDLRMRPGKHRRTLESCGIPVAVDQVEKLLAAARHHRPECASRCAAGIEGYPPPDGEDRIEYCSCGVGQRLVIDDRCSACAVVSPTEKAHPFGFDLHGLGTVALDDREMSHPNFRVRLGPPPPSRDQRAAVRLVLRFDEHFRERRMRNIRSG